MAVQLVSSVKMIPQSLLLFFNPEAKVYHGQNHYQIFILSALTSLAKYMIPRTFRIKSNETVYLIMSSVFLVCLRAEGRNENLAN